MENIFLISVLILANLSCFAQKERSLIRDGNGKYADKKYDQAEVCYQKAVNSDSTSIEANYNLAAAYYKQKKYDQADKVYDKLNKNQTDKKTLGNSLYNQGNNQLKKAETLNQEKKYEDAGKYLQNAAESYKNALRNNPNDLDAKYNLGLTQQLLKQNQQQQKQQDKDNQDKNKDKNKDQKNKDKNQDKKDQQKKDQDQKDQQKKDQEKDKDNKNKEGKPKQAQISDEDAKRMLEAINQKEKEVQDKVKREKAKAEHVKVEKDW
jgi:tetratricopeptide (TPR) repeat protein